MALISEWVLYINLADVGLCSILTKPLPVIRRSNSTCPALRKLDVPTAGGVSTVINRQIA